MRLCTVLLVWSVCALAEARPPRRIALHYTRDVGAQACVDPGVLARKVEAFTGPVLVAPAQAEASLEVHVRSERSGFAAQLQLSEPGVAHGERSLQHAGVDCTGFTDTLAFVIATTVDPDLVLERVGALFATEQPPERALLAELERAPPRPTQPRARVELGPIKRVPVRQLRTRVPGLSAGVVISDEAIRPGFGFTATPRLAWHHFALAVPLRAMFGVGPIERERVDVRTAALGFDVLGCARHSLSARFVAALCVGPTVSALRASGSGAGGAAGWAWAAGVQLRPELSMMLSARRGLVLAPFVSYLAPERRITMTAPYERVLARTDAFAFGAALELLRVF